MIDTLRAVFDTYLAGTLLPAMALFAALDFLAATVGHLRAGTFTFLLWGRWAGDKGVPIVSVAILYAAGEAAKHVTLPTGDADLSLVFIGTATAMAVAFIGTQVASIGKNLQTPPAEEPVPEEGVLPPPGG
jgi:hypothetical protein